MSLNSEKILSAATTVKGELQRFSEQLTCWDTFLSVSFHAGKSTDPCWSYFLTAEVETYTFLLQLQCHQCLPGCHGSEQRSRFDNVLEPLLFYVGEDRENSKFFFYHSKVLKSLNNKGEGCIHKHIEKCNFHFLQCGRFCFSSASVLISISVFMASGELFAASARTRFKVLAPHGTKKLLFFSLKQPCVNTFIFALHVRTVVIGLASAVLKGAVKLL